MLGNSYRSKMNIPGGLLGFVQLTKYGSYTLCVFCTLMWIVAGRIT